MSNSAIFIHADTSLRNRSLLYRGFQYIYLFCNICGMKISNEVLCAAHTLLPNARRHILHDRAYNGDSKTTKRLLEDGASSSTKDGRSRTALHEAARSGHIEVIQLLLKKGTDISCYDDRGRTALHEAASKGHEKIVQLLLEMGADLSAQDEHNRTALHDAASKGNDTVTQILLENGANHSCQDNANRTPLHFAAYEGHVTVVQLLLENGADFSCQDAGSKTAFQLAEIKGHKVVLLVLGEKIAQSQNIGTLKQLSSANLQSNTQYQLRCGVPPPPPPHMPSSPFSVNGKPSSSVITADFVTVDSLTEDSIMEEGEVAKNHGKELDSGEREGESIYEDSLFYDSLSLWDHTGYIKSNAVDQKGKGKRIADLSRGRLEHPNFSTKRVKKNDEYNGRSARGGDKTAEFRCYACPFYMNNAQENQSCRMWNGLSVHEVKRHCRRTHLRLSQCLNCGIQCAGDSDQISVYHFLGKCKRAAEITPIDRNNAAKEKYLNRRGLNWKQIYEILFPECIEKEIPSPYWEKPADNRTTSFPNRKSLLLPTRTTSAGWMNKYIQSQSPRALRECQDEQQGIQYRQQLSPTRARNKNTCAKYADTFTSCQRTTNARRTSSQ